MSARGIINESVSLGVALSVRDGKILYYGEAQAVAAILPLLRENKADIINELRGGSSGSPSPSDPWECPTGYARHREFWTSAHGLRICSICHPQPVKGGATWKQ